MKKYFHKFCKTCKQPLTIHKESGKYIEHKNCKGENRE
jgi:hypothetical protein